MGHNLDFICVISTMVKPYKDDPILSHLSSSCSKSLPVFHRCIPMDVACYAEFAKAFITFVSDNSVLYRVVAGVMASKEIIMGLCLLALGRLPLPA